jgi:acetyl/propionyl-CoA carboxylase alpha subunit
VKPTKLMVANRGEIAVRIMHTAHSLGIATVAVHPADDADCLHVRRAGEAVRLPGSGAAAYLDVDAVVAAARKTGCDAVHPGYGFLSENAALAYRCEREGLIFIGPTPEAVALFGSKTASRELAAGLGVPVLAGTHGPTSLDAAERFLADLGPGGAVMVKALAGGGGRGMRPVTRASGLPAVFERCRSEALAVFGNGDLYVEQLLPEARHIEVQIVGDGTGAVSHLWDRDCSVQRRRQKLIELAPAPGLAPGVRDVLLGSAVRLGATAKYRGIGTVEFLVHGEQVAFLEVNPRIQVEHTVTEQVTGVDLVEISLRIAAGDTLADLGLEQDDLHPPRSVAVQLRVNTETLVASGEVHPATGTLSRFQPPSGRGIRVDTHGYLGYRVNPRFDSLLAKVIVSEASGDLGRLRLDAAEALRQFDVFGVATNRALLFAVLRSPQFTAGAVTTGFVDDHLSELLEAAAAGLGPDAAPVATGGTEDFISPADPEAPPGFLGVRSSMTGTVVDLAAAVGDDVQAGTALLVIEAMKMEHVVVAPASGRLAELVLTLGDIVTEGAVVAVVEPVDDAAAAAEEINAVDPDHIRADLADVLARRDGALDAARPAAVEKRRRSGQRTARENLDALFDPGTFTEYGRLTLAAQRARRTAEELVERTPADGMVSGFGDINGQRVLGLAYDATVLGGTQGLNAHRKKNRLLDIARRHRNPVVVFAEGGGGRPGETEMSYLIGIEEPTFTLFARMSGLVPRVAIVSGRSFAGNAAMAGLADIIIATEGANLGMAGKAMIEGAGLGNVETEDIGPMSVQTRNGVVDILVADEIEAVAVTRKYLSYFQGRTDDWACADQRLLRHVIPENRLRSYDVQKVIELVADTGSVLELRPSFGVGIVTALIRVEGRPMGLIANNARHLGGAIDGPAADKAARFVQLCDAFGLPVLSLCDTPGFMVGLESEATATVRRFSRMMLLGANATVPIVMIVTRKAYGLGAMGMAGGDVRVPIATMSWPTGEFGGMGLEGFVRLAYRAELAAIEDEAVRQARYQELLDAMYAQGRALNVATVFEIDDVIDPADTRRFIVSALQIAENTQSRPANEASARVLVEPW